MLIEIVVLILAIIAAIVLYRILKAVIPLVINSIVALFVLLSLNSIGLGVEISIWSVLTVAIGGVPGLILVVALHLLGIAF